MPRFEIHHLTPRFLGGLNGPTKRITIVEHAKSHFDASRASRAEGKGGDAYKHGLAFDMIVSRMTTGEMMELTETLMDEPTRRGS